MNEAPYQLQVRVGQGPLRVAVGDEESLDAVRPLNALDHRNARFPALVRIDGVTGEPDSASALAGCVVMSIRGRSKGGELRNADWVLFQAGGNPAEVVHGLVDAFA